LQSTNENKKRGCKDIFGIIRKIPIRSLFLCAGVGKTEAVKFIEKNTKSGFGNIVVIDNSFDYGYVDELEKLGYVKSNSIPSNRQNILLIRPESLISSNAAIGYKNIFFLRRCFKNEHDYLRDTCNVFIPEYITKLSAKLTTARETLGLCFVNIKNNMDILATSVFEWASKLSKLSKNLTEAELVFALLVFSELNILNIDMNNGSFTVTKGEFFNQKRELQESKLYNAIEKAIPKK